MTGWLRDFRLIPIVLIAAGCLFALKSTGLIFDGGYTLGQRMGGGTLVVTTKVPVSPTIQLHSPATALEASPAQPGGSKRSWMQEMFNYPDITGSVATKPAAKDSTGKQPAGDDKKGPPMAQNAPETRPVDGTVIPVDQSRSPSGAERALLERLQERRQELDARSRELDMRESLLKAAEKKLDGEVGGKKAGEAKDSTPGQRKEDADAARLKSIVTMYEAMKPKDAAKIFDRLDIRVLLDVASQINPRRMSDILAQMTPEAAERLTVELAARGGTETTVNPSNLPKIDGTPN
jgi:flagellar motility protein MotE (MotC chaperone)